MTDLFMILFAVMGTAAAAALVALYDGDLEALMFEDVGDVDDEI